MGLAIILYLKSQRKAAEVPAEADQGSSGEGLGDAFALAWESIKDQIGELTPRGQVILGAR